ncbi:MAG: cytochrome c peroxidase [Gemmatimonadota bacterium]
MNRSYGVLILAALVAGSTTLRGAATQQRRATWSADELATLQSLALSSLEPLAPDPSNRVADDSAAASLGRRLFFDARLSANGKVACATCHLPEHDFQDNTPLARGVGTTPRRTMPIAGTAHSPWFFWDGRMDSQWSQALGPLESSVEHGGDRTQYARLIAAYYRKDYERVFGRMPQTDELPEHAGPNGDSTARALWSALSASERDEVSRVYANMGKAIAAFERTVTFGESRFDRFVSKVLVGGSPSAADSLTSDEVAGLRLFIGKANCINCHNGPRFTDDHFHNTGVAASPLVAAVDSGRAVGVRQALQGEFSCTSRHSDAKPEQCSELRFAVTEGHELVRAYKTPSLRNVAARAPFMHAGQLATLSDVVAHYNRAPRAPLGKSELRPLKLSKNEERQLQAFLQTLSAAPVVRTPDVR